jgi:RND family efflux transporter MFP subunit
MTQNNPMRVFVDVPQSAAADLAENQSPVEVRPSSGSGQIYTARVARTSQALDQSSRTLRVEVDLDNPKQTLVPGMYVKVGFALQPKGAVEIPAAALTFRAGGAQVARVDNSDRVTFQHVTIARDDGNMVELDSGVSPGDRLALNVSSQVLDGDRVQPKLIATAAPAPTGAPAAPVPVNAAVPTPVSAPAAPMPVSAAVPTHAAVLRAPATAAGMAARARSASAGR